MGRPLYIWGAAALATAGLTGALVVAGSADRPVDASDRDGKAYPVRSEVRAAALKTTDQGRQAALTQRDTERFSMLGVTWTDPSARFTGTVEPRARAVGSGQWSNWLRLDGDSGQGEAAAQRGGTEPAWTGPSDGVEVRVTAGGKTSATLPRGLRLDMVDPGEGGSPDGMEPAVFRADTTAEATPSADTDTPEASEAPATETSPSDGTTIDPTEPEAPSAPATTSEAPPPSAPSSDSVPPSTSPGPTATLPSAPPSTAPRPTSGQGSSGRAPAVLRSPVAERPAPRPVPGRDRSTPRH